jgi:glycosyltransferase involved in cell wall biosynthesis
MNNDKYEIFGKTSSELPKYEIFGKISPKVAKSKKIIKVMFCGTYPIGQSNGYSRVVYYISKYLGIKDDIQLTIYGFQNVRNTINDGSRTDIPKNVIIHDALESENPKRNGFGELEIPDYIKAHPQDIIIIFNDMIVTTAITKNIIEKLSADERKSFKLISYMDQVYPFQKSEYITLLNTYYDGIITFTPYWESVLKTLGLKEDMPTYFFPHGFDSTLYYPIPKKIARLYYELPQDAFIILNLNRNQPRKRWDHTMMAFADVVERHHKLKIDNPTITYKPIRLMIGTTLQGSCDLLEVFKFELKKRNISFDIGKEYLTMLAKPQQITDREINILYNSCDIGINTCDGEGFGLCQFEHLGVGCPQVVGNIGGFREYINSKNSTVLEPKWNYYIDNIQNGISGYAEVSDPIDFANGIWDYYMFPEKCAAHGCEGRKEIIQNYSWETMVNILYKIIKSVNHNL